MKRSKSIGFILAIFTVLYMAWCVPQVWADEEADNLFNRGKFEYADDHYQAALDYLKKALARDPDNLEYKYYLALTQIKLGRVNEGVAVMETLVAKDPAQYNKVYFDLGTSYMQLKQWSKAIEMFDKALKIDPRRADVVFNVGIAYLNQEKYPEAVNFFNKAKTVDPKFAQVSEYHIGLCQFKMEQYDRAKTTLETAIRSNPNTPVARNCELLLKNMDIEQRARKPWSLAATVGVQYDDNVNMSPLNDAGISKGSPTTGKGDTSFTGLFSGSYNLLNEREHKVGIRYGYYQNLY
ncbi:MAG: tetratricopeptide repeat protein, partial [Deltaproteobacteria bacterium]|nr:tetratricopeptide repeat protein [Deltaproteobacteria bacterium]